MVVQKVPLIVSKPVKVDLNKKVEIPDASKKNILITAALPYCNNVPHLGNIVGCVLSGDVYARFAKLSGSNVLYVCGTDEYGTTTEVKALQVGKTPAEICEEYHAKHKAIYDYFNIGFSLFGRTATEQQTEITLSIFEKSYKNGYMRKQTDQVLYCTKCKLTLADRYVEGTCPKCSYEKARGDQCDSCLAMMNSVDLGNPRCSICKQAPEQRPTDHIYFNLPAFEGAVTECFPQAKSKWSASAYEIYAGWLRNKLKPRSITRDLKWGTKVPEYAGVGNKVFYVWYDAPIGYVSITANLLPDSWQKWWKPEDPAIINYIQFMAKDNVPFHSIYFPSTLLSTKENWKLVDSIAGTHYLLYEDQKFSKSNNIGIFGDQVKDLIDFDVDFLRLYLIYIRPESKDSNFKWDAFFEFYQNVVLANVGNLVNRCLSFTHKHFGDKLPVFKADLATEYDSKIIEEINEIYEEFKESMDNQKLNAGLRLVFEISSKGNLYFNDTAPWTKAKDPNLKQELENILSLTCSIIFFLSITLEPFAPSLAKKIRANFSTTESYELPAKFVIYDLTEFELKSPEILVKRYNPQEKQAFFEKFAKFSSPKVKFK